MQVGRGEMRVRRVGLSVDWDFFFESNPDKYDWKQKESSIFANEAWFVRLLIDPRLTQEFVPRGYKGFWRILKSKQLLPDVIRVGDSHMHAHTLFLDSGKIDELWHFDTHHDLWSGVDGKDKISCDNWLRLLLRARRRLEVYWVYPKNCHFVKDFRNPFKRRFIPMSWRDFKNEVEPMKVQVLAGYVARSGAWTPPWTDKLFHEWLESSGAHLVPALNPTGDGSRILEQRPVPNLEENPPNNDRSPEQSYLDPELD